jgi:hypothetical protein
MLDVPSTRRPTHEEKNKVVTVKITRPSAVKIRASMDGNLHFPIRSLSAYQDAGRAVQSGFHE